MHEVQVYDKTARRIFVTMTNEDIYIINLTAYQLWLADTGRLEYDDWDGDQVVPLVEKMSLTHYWEKLNDKIICEHLISYLIQIEKLCVPHY